MQTKFMVDQDLLKGYFLSWKQDEGNKTYYVDFEIYEMNHVLLDKDGNKDYFEFAEYIDTPKFSKNKDDITPLFDGHLKWDGCINFNDNENEDGVMKHQCGLDGFLNEFRMWTILYRECVKIMEKTADLDCMGVGRLEILNDEKA